MSDVARIEDDLQASSPEIALAPSKAGVSGFVKAYESAAATRRP